MTCETCRLEGLALVKEQRELLLVEDARRAAAWRRTSSPPARPARASRGDTSSEAVVIGWPDVVMRARKVEPETSLSFCSRSSHRSSWRSLMTSPLRFATRAPPVESRPPCTPAARAVYTRRALSGQCQCPCIVFTAASLSAARRNQRSRLRSYAQDGDRLPDDRRTPQRHMGLKGRLAELALADLIEMTSLGGKTGLLTLFDDRRAPRPASSRLATAASSAPSAASSAPRRPSTPCSP